MPKKPRLKGGNLYHHIYAWGNDRHPVFKADSHYEKYLSYLESCSLRYKIDVIAYALLEWHIHLFVHDKYEKVSEFMNNLHGDYARYFNSVTKRVGHVFGERFNNRVVQTNEYGLWLSRYIHRQAVEAGIVKDPKDYSWTSYCAYLGLVPRGVIKPEVILGQFGSGRVAIRDYEEFVLGVEEGPVNWSKPLGLVIGDKSFVKKFEVSKEAKTDVKQGLNAGELKVLVNEVSCRLGVKSRLLLCPLGKKERQLRREAFRILINEYGLSLRKVAKLFNISAPAVLKAVRQRAEKKKS